MTSQPDRIAYRSGYKYQLAETYTIRLNLVVNARVKTEFIEFDSGGFLTIHRGYAWDGPSGPTIDTASAMRGSLVHDALYQLMRTELLDRQHRHSVDKEFRRLCLQDGMWKIRAWYFFRGVDWFAADAAKAKSRNRIKYAP